MTTTANSAPDDHIGDVDGKVAASAKSGAPVGVPPRWYTVEEIRHYLKCMNYSDCIAIELSTWFVRHLQLAFNKGFEKGQRTAAPKPASGVSDA